jgi:hypothetical protein
LANPVKKALGLAIVAATAKIQLFSGETSWLRGFAAKAQ